MKNIASNFKDLYREKANILVLNTKLKCQELFFEVLLLMLNFDREEALLNAVRPFFNQD